MQRTGADRRIAPGVVGRMVVASALASTAAELFQVVVVRHGYGAAVGYVGMFMGLGAALAGLILPRHGQQRLRAMQREVWRGVLLAEGCNVAFHLPLFLAISAAPVTLVVSFDGVQPAIVLALAWAGRNRWPQLGGPWTAQDIRSKLGALGVIGIGVALMST